MSLNLQNFQAFGDIINRLYEDNLKSIPWTMKTSGLIVETQIPDGSWSSRRHVEFPHSEEYASTKTEGGQSITAIVQEWYSKDTVASTISKNIVISLEWRRLWKQTEIKREIERLTKFVPNREDLDLSMFFSFGTSTSYVNQDGATVDISTWDGLSLFNTAHTLKGSSTTYRNIVSWNPQISRSALEAAEQLIVRETYNNLGQTMAMEFDTIFSTDDPQTVNTIRELLKSTASVSAPNAWVENVYQAKYKHVVLKRIDMTPIWAKDITKAKMWGLASSMNSTFHHDVYMSPFLTTPAQWNNGEDILTLDWTYTTTGSFWNCVVDGRWLKVSLWTWV